MGIFKDKWTENLLRSVSEASVKVGDKITTNPKYNKNEDWVGKPAVVTKVSGNKVEFVVDGETAPTVLTKQEVTKIKK
tara:strand:+ start:551 stop:784 length:234 start_codon:yes stop_codon:yes gene_type:complete